MGTETCREFARNGANVALLDLDGKRVETAAEALAQAFGREMIKAGKGRLHAPHPAIKFSGYKNVLQKHHCLRRSTLS